jgi:MarR family multiple antibiotic resistance transcriptional regulator
VLDVADSIGITGGAASKLGDRLEGRGYCVRHPNPADGRSSLLTITEKGRKYLPRLARLVEATLQQALVDITADPSTSEETLRALSRFENELSD